MRTEKEIQFKVHGEPKPRQSVRYRVVKPVQCHKCPHGERIFAQPYQPKTGPAADWLRTVAHEAIQHKPPALLTDALEVQIVFNRLKPKSWGKGRTMPTTKPDLENLTKPLVDVLEGMYFQNDAQICRMVLEKRLADEPSAEIVIKRLEEER